MSGIVLFDGECNLCNRAVDFIIRYDRKKHYQFASLQSDLGILLKKEFGLSDDLDSIVVIEHNQAFIKSDAAMQIIPKLSVYWQPLRVLKFLPKLVRERMYEWIARNRLRWFGEKDTCRLPKPEERDRFLS
ncbi:thiol-disulfide oxidoreductase DCC family protein [Shouchella patagoniensis]|uniref:thiol-disulfide oxidoreductase DCC family protein n=1 Tax=Shouchella patagoniensis TaxID=228576 RepID=UPI000994B53B|nr:DCC1-like thiol-disulfide oxidoreductase family protein [Shouchella patagoniensis]